MVFVGGGLGSLCRYGIAYALRDAETVFPYATFWANVVSCIILGVFAGLALKSGWSQNTNLLLLTGFCGGFSTFSTFTMETFQLLQAGDYTNALLNVLISIIVCLGCIILGLKFVS